jgi:hypothetical protein
MNDENYKSAFMRGVIKRAEYYGLEKSALIPTIAATALRIAAPFVGQHYITKLLGRVGGLKGAGALGTQAKNVHNLLTQSPMVPSSLKEGLAGQAAFMGTSMLSSRLLDPVVEPVARKIERFDIPKEQRKMYR